MPRLRINIRDMEELTELDLLDEFAEPAPRGTARPREERRSPHAERSVERKREERRRGKEIARFLKRLEK